MKLFRKKFVNLFNLRQQQKNPIINFTSKHHLEEQQKKAKKDKSQEMEQELLNIGRSWRMQELNLKSNEELHKLWYVLLRDKNSILSDAALYIRSHGEAMEMERLTKVEKSMNRLKEVLRARQKIRQNYKKYLEDLYTKQKQKELAAKMDEIEKDREFEPEITHEILRQKYLALNEGRDDLNYLEKFIKMKKEKKELKEYLKKKYDYKYKKIVDSNNLTEEDKNNLDKNKYILTFENQIKEQLKEGKNKLSQEEVLRAHIKNWKMLDLKQRRVVVNFLNTRRANDAKNEFMRELDILAQKIAYENKKLEKKSS